MEKAVISTTPSQPGAWAHSASLCLSFPSGVRIRPSYTGPWCSEGEVS